MKKTLLPVLAACLLLPRLASGVPRIDPPAAMEKVASGTAVLIDVREPGEWKGGVVEGALLLPLSDLKGGRQLWAEKLESANGRELVLYCRSGNRSGIAGALLEKEGWTVWNAGGFSGWVQARMPVKTP